MSEVTNGVGAFEGSAKHAFVCGRDAQVFAEEGGEVGSGLGLLHDHSIWRLC